MHRMQEGEELPQIGEKRSLEKDKGQEKPCRKPEPRKKKERRPLNFSFVSDTLDKEVSYVAGIDEAGRGPVLGPMVYSIAFFPFEDNDKKLREIGFNDSKQLSEAQRDKLFEQIYKHNVGFIVDPLHAELLSTEMLKVDRRNLNRISHDSAIGLIGKVLQMGFKLKSVFVDTVGNPDVYQRMLREEYPSISQITVSKKADSIYPIVGAASICAKVIRDRLLAEWQFKEKLSVENTQFGSGYPGDQITKDWLVNTREHVFGFSSLVRYSWSTVTNLLNDAAPVYWSFEDIQAFEEINAHARMSEGRKSTLRDASERAERNKESLKNLKKRYNFFAANGMSRVTSL